jgi:hypothetical protein
LAARLRTAAESHLSHPPSGFHEWLERRVALADAAMVAAQAVIGQCDCIMAEGPQDDPKRTWREARDAWRNTR